MKKRTLLNVTLLAMPLLFPSWALAAESAPAATQTQQGRTPEEHAGHAESAGGGSWAGRGGVANGAGRPMAWTAFPTLKARMGSEGRDRRMVTVIPQNIAVNSIDAYSNDIKDARGHRQLPLEMAGVRLDKPEAGGFHWLTAREEQGGQVKVASTVHFFAGSGAKTPTAMFMQQKQELEIIPQPYPREHSRYRAKEDWKFLVRFNGKPLANQKVLLETSNGTKAELVSDTQGVVTVRMPDDFKEEAQQRTAGGHDHGRRSSDFVLAAEHAEGGKNYLTAFNGSYGPDAFDQRSLAMGLGFTLLGMIGATPLLRQRKDKKKAEAEQNTATPAATEATQKEGA